GSSGGSVSGGGHGSWRGSQPPCSPLATRTAAFTTWPAPSRNCRASCRAWTTPARRRRSERPGPTEQRRHRPNCPNRPSNRPTRTTVFLRRNRLLGQLGRLTRGGETRKALKKKPLSSLFPPPAEFRTRQVVVAHWLHRL